MAPAATAKTPTTLAPVEVGLAAMSRAPATTVASAPAPVLGLSGSRLSLQSAARMPDGSVVLGGQLAGRPFVARVRPNGRLEERFGVLGLWRAGSGTRVEQVRASPGGTGILAVTRGKGGLGEPRLLLLTPEGRLRGELRPTGSLGSVAVVAFQGDEIAVAAGAGCSRCQIQRFDATTGRSAGPPVGFSLPLQLQDRCAGASIRSLAAAGEALLATVGTGVAGCDGVALLVDRAGNTTAHDGSEAVWTVGPPIPGGQACAMAPTQSQPGGAMAALGVVGSPGLVLPRPVLLPVALTRGGAWTTRSVFATGTTHCGALLESADRRGKALLLTGEQGLEVVMLAGRESSVVAARCRNHVLVFGIMVTGAVRQVVVQATPLSKAERASRSRPPASAATPCDERQG